MPRILVVDDEPSICHLVGEHLREMGAEYDEAYDGEQALRKLCQATLDGKPYDAVVLDIVMPVMDGWHVLHAIKNNPLWQSMRVIVLTGQATSPSDVIRVIDYDGVFVEKKGSFANMVQEIMGRIL
ncbi:MAG: response regulator [Armatimonadetes bacterium]|nr:response regulator [Armatimonadota bacterium]